MVLPNSQPNGQSVTATSMRGPWRLGLTNGATTSSAFLSLNPVAGTFTNGVLDDLASVDSASAKTTNYLIRRHAGIHEWFIPYGQGTANDTFAMRISMAVPIVIGTAATWRFTPLYQVLCTLSSQTDPSGGALGTSYKMCDTIAASTTGLSTPTLLSGSDVQILTAPDNIGQAALRVDLQFCEFYRVDFLVGSGATLMNCDTSSM